jgi:hypothetical protein
MTLLPESTSTSRAAVVLAPWLRWTLVGIAVLNIVVGLLFELDPEFGSAPWPTDIPPALVRFVGAIVIANGVGALVVARQGTWEGARALFTVALVYGLVALVAGLAQLATVGLSAGVLFYVVLDLVFIGPIAAIGLAHERRARAAARPA